MYMSTNTSQQKAICICNFGQEFMYGSRRLLSAASKHPTLCFDCIMCDTDQLFWSVSHNKVTIYMYM